MTQVSSIQTATAFGPSRSSLLIIMCVAVCGCDDGDERSGDAGGSDVPRCDRDDSKNFESAVELSGGEATGSICPREDEDWYKFSITADAPIVNIRLAMDNPRSPIEVTYGLWTTRAGEPDTAITLPNPEAVGGALNDSYHLEPGDYFIVIRDQGDDMEDLRNHYKLTITTIAQPDKMEPNDSPEEASEVTSGEEVTGYIASANDEDWYAVEVPAGSVIRITLTMPDSNVAIAVKLVDANGELIVEDQDRADDGSDTRLVIVRVLADGGTYYVVISDYDRMNGDAEVPYTLLIEVVKDRDQNEPNDHPSEATPLIDGAINCTADWSDWTEVVGTVGSPGDNDWYALTINNCRGGIIEANITLGAELSATAAWALQDEVQASVTLVREHVASPCAAGDDELCRSLTTTCSSNPPSGISWDCQGYFNSCPADELCTGATVCLPSGNCGANQTQRSYQRQATPDPIGDPPDNTARLSAPILANGTYYLRVSDFQADGGDPEALYTMRVRTRLDPDPGDAKTPPNNLYGNTLTDDALPLEQGREGAALVPVLAAGGCTSDGPWISGSLSYENDLDFWYYEHPCPIPAEIPPPPADPLLSDGDCLLKLVYQVDPGTVAPAIFIYNGTSAFQSFPLSPGSSGSFGGVGAGNQCFYAYSAHSEYTIMVIDQAADGRNWDADQGYRFCLEKVSEVCEAPCYDYDDDPIVSDCGPPCEGANCDP